MKYSVNILSNLMEQGSIHITPLVGMKCVQNYYTDRRVCTIVDISKSGKKIKVQDNKVTTINFWESKYQIHDELEGKIVEFTLRKNGRWVRLGDSQNGLGLILNSDNHFIDPTF